MKTAVHIVVQARFGLSDEFCDVEVTHSTFDELTEGIKKIYPNCRYVTIVLHDNDATIINATSYDKLVSGASLTAGLTGRSIKSTVAVKGKYADEMHSAYVQELSVAHSSLGEIITNIMILNPECTFDRLDMLRAGHIVPLDEDSYESLSPDEFITAYVTRTGNREMGSHYSTIDAFNAKVLNFKHTCLS